MGLRKKRLSEEERKVCSPVRNKLAAVTKGKHACAHSIRAWRGLRYNEKYASKLERKLARKQERDRAPKALLEGHNNAHQSVNPFAVRCGPQWQSVFRAD